MFKQQFLQELENLLNQGKQKYYTVEEMGSVFLIKRGFDDKQIMELDCQNKRIVVSEPMGELYVLIEKLFKQLEFEYKIVIEIYGEFYETKNVLEQNGFVVLADTDYTAYEWEQVKEKVNQLSTIIDKNTINIVVLMD